MVKQAPSDDGPNGFALFGDGELLVAGHTIPDVLAHLAAMLESDMEGEREYTLSLSLERVRVVGCRP